MVRKTFRLLKDNVRLLIPLFVVTLVVTVAVVGLPDGFNEAKGVLATLPLVMVWLTTIFFLRNSMAGEKVSFFDGIYKAMAPLNSTLVVLVVAIIECLPIAILVIAYSAAVETHFLETFGYAVAFVIFALLMVGATGFLLTSTLVALAAVSAPGLYPLAAMRMATELTRGRRMRMMGRLMALVVMVAAFGAVILLPLYNFAPAWVVSGGTMAVGIVVTIFSAAYLYVNYRELIDE